MRTSVFAKSAVINVHVSKCQHEYSNFMALSDKP